MEEGEDGTMAAAASPRRIVYKPFAENAEAGPSRPRLSKSSRASPRFQGPPSDEDAETSVDERSSFPDSNASNDSDDSGGSDDSDSSHSDAARSHSSHSGDAQTPPGDEQAPPEKDAPPGDKEPPGDEEAPPRKRRRPGPRPRPKPVLRKDVSGAPGFKWYDGDFNLHQSYTERHFRGVFNERDNQMGWEPSVSLPIISFWTPEEKGRFFAALARHSRLRPDLIALDVQTKNELEVSQYIDLLGTSIELRPDRKGLHEETQEWRDHLLGDGAYEVPADVVEKEEHLAGLLELIDQSTKEEKNTGFRRVPGRPSRPMTREARAAIEAWGEDLTTDKMDLTADLLWLATAGPKERPLPEGETEKEAIEADNEMIDLLNGIQRKDRTQAQGQTLRMLNNRRKMRQTYRRKRLHAQGWTDAQIDAAGGPDAVFVALKPGGAKRKGKAANVEEVDPALAKMKELGLETYLENRGWELFNFDRMAQFIELYQRAYGVAPTTYTDGVASTTTARGTSFAVLFAIYKLIWEYVRDMIRHTYIIATAADIHNTEVQEWHIESLLQAHGIPDPPQQLRDAVKQFQRLSKMASDREEGVVRGAEPAQGPQHAEDQAGRRAADEDVEGSDDEAGSHAPDGQGDVVVQARRRRHYASLHEMAPAPPIVVEPPPDSDVWMPMCTKTDDEDSELDERLEAVDTALDTVMAYQLRGAAKSHSGLRLDDHAWLDKPGNRGRGWREARGLISVPFDARAQLAQAQNAYRELMAKVTNDRRKRRKMAERTKRFPRHQAELAAARNRRHPPVPLHVLAKEWMDDDETMDDHEIRERPLDLPPITKKTPRRKRKRGAASSESADDSEDEILRRLSEAGAAREKHMGAEGRPRSRRGSVSDESEKWEASGDSSAAMTTDEDEPARPPPTPVIVLSQDSEDEPMDVDAPPSEEEDEEMDDDDEPSMEVLGGDDALDSGDEAGDEGHDEADEPADRSVDLVGGGDVLDPDDKHPPSRKTPAYRPTEDLVGGDDALDSSSEDRPSAPLPNGHASSSRSPDPQSVPNGRLSPHKSSNGPTASPHASYKQTGSDFEDEGSDNLDDDDRIVAVAAQPPDFDALEDASDDSGGPDGWSGVASPVDEEDDEAQVLLGGDDALDSDSD